MLRDGPLDELLLFIHPTILGAGRALFDDLEKPHGCELMERATYEHGVVMHRYAIT